MMRHITSCFVKYQMAIEKKLFVYDAGMRDGTMDHLKTNLYSGIRATIFGASGNLGKPIAAQLGLANSSLIMPLNLDHNFRHSEHLKELRTVGATNRIWVDYSMNYKDHKQIQRYVQNSNVVVNLLGPRHKLKKREDFEFINIQVPERIAHACKKNGIHRFVHFSAAGAELNSSSIDFQTKALGEEVVKKMFPNVTILRPCPVYGLNDNFASIIRGQLNFFWNKFIIVYDDSTALKQPIRENDVAKCVLNALKLEETKGKTYELGGPHQLAMLEIYEIMFNILKVRPTIAYANPAPFELIGKYIYNWPHFNLEMLRKIEQIVKKEKYGTIQDLMVQPVSFKNGVFQLLREYIAYYRDIDEDYDN